MEEGADADEHRGDSAEAGEDAERVTVTVEADGGTVGGTIGGVEMLHANDTSGRSLTVNDRR